MLGWCLIAKGSSNADKDEEIGYIASDYLTNMSGNDDLQKYLGFACHENPNGEDTTVQQQYMAVEDYYTEDPCQLCLKKDETVLVIEMCEDGK